MLNTDEAGVREIDVGGDAVDNGDVEGSGVVGKVDQRTVALLAIHRDARVTARVTVEVKNGTGTDRGDIAAAKLQNPNSYVDVTDQGAWRRPEDVQRYRSVSP